MPEYRVLRAFDTGSKMGIYQGVNCVVLWLEEVQLPRLVGYILLRRPIKEHLAFQTLVR
jgi:hypothetical protein